MPEVSVVVPAFNAAAFLRESIDSALGQTFRDLEVIVVDDGSTDGTKALLRGYGDAIVVVHQPNAGVSAARNVGIARSRGRLIAFLDADDVWHAQKLERQLAALATHPAHRACYTALEIVDVSLRTMRINSSTRRGRAIEDLLILGNVVSTPSSVVCDRRLLDETGGFDPALSYAADWDLWVRLSARTEFLYVNEPLVKYRQHHGSLSEDVPLIERDNLRSLRKSFAMTSLPSSVRCRRREAFGRNYRVLSGIYYRARRRLDAIRCGAQAIVLDPRQAYYIAGLPLRRSRNAG